jgi:formylmethanofuran dehydrogenase subunit B
VLDLKKLVCVGCSLLCDDVAASTEEGEVRSLGLCRLGHEHLSSAIAQSAFKLDSDSIERAIDVLKFAESPLLLGWVNSTNETIKLGQELASVLSGHLSVSACPGLFDALSSNLHPKGLEINLDDVRNNAELVVYWGTNPSESSHRHVSRFAVLPRGEKIPEGVESRAVAVVDIRQSESMKMANHRFILSPGQDSELLDVLKGEISGDAPIKEDLGSISAQEMIGFANGFKKSDYSVIFYGSGVFSSSSSEKNLSAFVDFIESCNRSGYPTYALPMAAATNIMGTNKMTANGKFIDGLMEDEFDAALVVGEDVLATLPGHAAQKLADMPIIYVGPPTGITYEQAEVPLPTMNNILAAEGTMNRVDMVEMKLEPFGYDANGQMTEFEVLSKLVEMISKRS